MYIGNCLKKFIEYPTLEERGAWLSITVALVQNDGFLPDDETLFFKCLCFNDKDKQVLKQVLIKCLSKTKKGWECKEVKELIKKQKTMRDNRRIAGSKGGAASRKNKQELKQSESESESELETLKKTSAKKVSLEELSVNHIRDWLAKKRTQGKYLEHNEHDILETFKNYVESKQKKGKPLYENFIAAYRNSFEWDRNQPKTGVVNQDKHQRTLEAATRGHLRAKNLDF
jgi:uncharacterized protein YdaU (DUF1376 family)